MSPWTDMTCSGESLTGRADIDPVLTPEYIYAVREAYAGDLDPAQPELSPLLADLAGFPPTLIQVGTHEILFSDAERLAERMKAAGTECRLEVWEGMWHDFQMYPSKSAAQAMQNAAHFLIEEL
ncbi:MAG: alpha/beta hydrolase fold domain-containing protein [Oscillospiraceae bacterium]